ncbi:MAG: DUF2269 family protein [Actinomycetota bacterium]|nr:DUF2269 family protein [Actinomycetota bacterium]
MSTYDWLLFLHLLGAAAIFAGLALFTAGLLETKPDRRDEGIAFLPIVRVGGVLFDVGGLLVVVFGIWLAFDADYGLTEGWVLAALVVYVVAALAGTRTRIRLRAASGQAAPFYAVTVLSVLVLLILMIFKPGA